MNPSSKAQKLIADIMQYSGDRNLIRVKRMFRCNEGLVIVVSLQQQYFVTAIYYGLDPSDLYFAQDAICAHLLKCLQEWHIALFPVLKKQSYCLAVLCTLEVEIFCLCCLP